MSTMLIFIDVEASALENGFPIEVGWAVVDPKTAELIATENHLIKPHPLWTAMCQNPASEAVHRIDRNALIQNGMSANAVAQRTTEQLAGTTCYSDNPAFDRRWLRLLFAAATGNIGIPETLDLPFKLADADLLLGPPAVSAAGYLHAESLFLDIPVPHRAGPDAERLARLYLTARAFDLARRTQQT